MRRWIWVAIVVVIGVAAALTVGDVRKLRDGLAGFDWRAFVAALALALANYAVRFVRWQIYLRDVRVSVPTGDSAVVFGAGLSLAITPAKLGELVKSYLLRELHDIPAPRTAPIVIAERVTDLVALLALATIGVAAYGMDPTLVVAAGALIGVGLVLLAWPRPTLWLIDTATRPRMTRRFRGPLHETYTGVVALCRPQLLAVATAVAIPAWACECVGFALVVNAFPGAVVNPGLAMAIYAATTIAGAVSFLPGGLGVTESAMTILLVNAAAGLDRATAIDATLLFRLATLWFGVSLGLVFLAMARARIARRPQKPPASQAPQI